MRQGKAEEHQYLNQATEQARQERDQYEQYSSPINEELLDKQSEEQALRDTYNNFSPKLRNDDFRFIDAVTNVINAEGFTDDKEEAQARLLIAGMYADNLNKPLDLIYSNFDTFHEQLTGKKFNKETGVKDATEAFEFIENANILNRVGEFAMEYVIKDIGRGLKHMGGNLLAGAEDMRVSYLGDVLRRRENDAPDFIDNALEFIFGNGHHWRENLRTVEDIENEIAQIRERQNAIAPSAPQFTLQEHIANGGLGGAFNWLLNGMNNVSANLYRNIPQMAVTAVPGMGAAAGVTKAAGAASKVFKLSSGVVKTTQKVGQAAGLYEGYQLTQRGLIYNENREAGLPDDINYTHTMATARLRGLLVAFGPGVTNTVTSQLTRKYAPDIVEQSIQRMFVKGDLTNTGLAVNRILRSGNREGLEELGEEIIAATGDRIARNVSNKRREEWHKMLDSVEEQYDYLAETVRRDMIKNLEKHPEFELDDFNTTFNRLKESYVMGATVGALLGPLEGGLELKHDREAAIRVAELAQSAPNIEAWNNYVEQGYVEIPIEGFNDLEAGQKKEIAERLYHIQQEYLTPEQREEKAKAEALSKKRLYGLTDQSGEIHRGEDDNLYIEHSRHTETNGIVTGEFAAGDPNKSETNIYAIGKYELRGDTAEITEFKIGENYQELQNEILQNISNDIGVEINYNEQSYTPTGEGQSIRFGWEADNKTTEQFNSNRQVYTAPDTQADITAKQNFTGQLKSLNTQLTNDAQINTVVDFYDTVGRKWFGMGFDSFMNRLTGGNTERWIHQNLSDDQIARWIAKNEGQPNAEAIQKIKNNLTDTQREEAKQRINGFATVGAEGITKAIYAAQNADVSTFIHEGVHAFTQLAKELDKELYNQMMEAAGFNQSEYDTADPASREEMTRKAMETLAYGAEAYLKEGPKTLSDTKLINLYERIKDFLKDLKDAVRKGEYLTPEVRTLFDDLFGDQTVARVDQEGATRTETSSARITENDQTEEAEETELELYSDSLDRIIKDDSRSIEERTKAVVRKAEHEYSLQKLEDTNNIFNAELDQYLEGKLETGHIFKLGIPGQILRNTGFPAGQDIELTASRLKEKSQSKRHPFDPADLKNLVKVINEPVAIFSYGEKDKAQNVIIGLHQNDNNYLIGIHFNQEHRGVKVSDIRGLFPKQNEFWLNWINQGKLLYANMEKLQAVITQQRTNPAEVSNINLEPIESLIKENAEVKDYYPEDNIYFQEAFHGSPFVNDLNRSNYFQHGYGRTFYSQKEAAEWAQNAISKTKGVEAQLLNASIPDDINLLHWEKPIAQQPNEVKNIIDSLITWNKSGKSEFNPAYNIRKFHDGNYGFYRSIDGKAKWGTIEEAQAAAREEIKKTLTGEIFYNTLAERIGKKETSLLLDHLGIKGTKYFDKNLKKIGVKSGHNYVIYGDSEIDITQTYFQEAFSKIEHTEEQKETIEAAKAVYGTTTDFREAGYILTDGNMLDLSGKNDGGQPGQRSLDHREMEGFEYNDKLYEPTMIGFINWGNIRMHAVRHSGHIELSRLPSAEQAKTIKDLIQYSNNGIYIDLANEYGDVENTIDYNGGIKPIKILNDIKNYFENGIVPEQVQTFYSESFRDAGLSEFMNNYPDVVKEASRFNSGAEMAEHYAEYFEMPDEVYKKANALGYFDAIARAAKEGNAENATNAITGISAEKAAQALSAYGVSIKDTLEAASLVRQDNWKGSVQLLEKQGVPRIDAETYADTAKLFSKTEMAWLEKQAAQEPDKTDETINIGKQNPAILKFFNAMVEGSKEIYPNSEIEALRTELAGEARTADAFINMINTDKGFNDLITIAYEINREGPQQGESDTETQLNEKLYNRIRAVFNPEGNGNWKTAFANIADKKPVNEHTKRIIRGMIRNRPLQYMEAWAMITGDNTWLPAESDIKRIKRLDTEGLIDEEYLEKQSPEEIERIGRRLSSDRLKKKIDDKTLLLNDPELEDYEKQLKEDMTKAQKLITEREGTFKEYQHYLDLAKNNAKKEQIIFEQEAVNTSDAGLKASRERTKGLYKAQQQIQNTIAEMERFMREDLLPSQREAFFELRKQLREQERINAELKAIDEIQEIKKRDIRQILRKPDLKTVSLREAKYIEWIQAHFDSYEAVARFIGRGAKDIRQLYNEFATNADYREKLKKELSPGAYKRIEGIVYEDITTQKVRAYGKISAHDRRVLYKNLLDNQGIFEKLGIDILAEPRKFNEAEWNAIKTEMQDFIPADVLQKLEGLLEADPKADRNEHTGRRFKVEDFNIEDLQTLAGVVNRLRKDGREHETARKDARKQLRINGREKIIKTLEANIPKNAAGEQMRGIASTRTEEKKRAGIKDIWFSLHNTRRFIRRLEGGKDGFLFDFITQREYDAFDQENRYVYERKGKVEKELKDAGIDIKELGMPNRFTLYNGQKVSLDEMISFYYAQFNERALNAVIFGNFASQTERKALKGFSSQELKEQLELESAITMRYWNDMKKLDDFFGQEGNEKYQKVMEIIGRDYDSNYDRLKEFVAREYNEELGSEPYYMPLIRQGIAAEENTEVEKALADSGLSRYISKGFTKGRTDIPPYAQQPIEAGMYMLWDRMVVKQEHLMAYDSFHRELQQIFKGPDSETIRDILRRGHSEAAIRRIDTFISELAAPPIQDDFASMDKINRVMRGHYPAAVLGWRIASIIKQGIESPPPFFQFINPKQYIAASASCLKQETRDFIYEKSVYMRARYFDPAAAVISEMQKMYLTGKIGKAEAVLAKIESTGMKPQTWIDSVCVMPGWLAAYNKKLAELKKSDLDMTVEEAEAQAVRYADIIVRDTQPSSVLMDRIPLLKGNIHPLAKMFMQFQTPIASIFQQLYIDAPNNFKHGRVLQGLWTWGIYALLAIIIGAIQEDDDGEELNPKKRGIDVAVMPVSMMPIFGGDIAYSAETLLRDGKIQISRRSYFPVLDQGIRAINAVSDEKWGKAGLETLKGFMYYTGLPVATFNDFEKAIKEGEPQRILGVR